MKIKEEKHNHKLTDILKVCIFAIILLLPFCAMLPSTLYFAFNHNASEYTEQTVKETYKYETNTLTHDSDLVVGNIYKLNGTFNHQSNFFYEIQFNVVINPETTSSITLVDYENNTTDYDTNEIYFYYTYDYKSDSTLTLYVGDFYEINVYAYEIEFNNVYIVLGYYESTNDNILQSGLLNLFQESDYLGQVTYTIEESQMNPLNVVSNSIENLENATWFNWVQNTTTYTTIKAMTDQLQIQLIVIPMLLTYWFLLIVIYLIIDIVMKVITTLTHMIGMKS